MKVSNLIELLMNLPLDYYIEIYDEFYDGVGRFEYPAVYLDRRSRTVYLTNNIYENTLRHNLDAHIERVEE